MLFSPSRRRLRRLRILLGGRCLPWAVLDATGNGVGGAPEQLMRLAEITDEEFDEVVYGLLLNRFWHQGTVYPATGHALKMVLTQINTEMPSERLERLLQWVALCITADAAIAPRGTMGGRWVTNWDRMLLWRHGVEVLEVHQVVMGHIGRLEELVSKRRSVAAAEVLAALQSQDRKGSGSGQAELEQ